MKKSESAAAVAATATVGIDTFLRDREVRSFSSIEEMAEFGQARLESDEWNIIPQSQVEFFGYTKCPIMAATMELPEEYEGTSDDIRDAMCNMSLHIRFFDVAAQAWRAMPTRFTSWDSIFERAHVGGATFTAYGDEDGKAHELAPERRAELLTEFFRLWGDQECKLLIRDGKVSTVRSGKFKPLSDSELMLALVDEVIRVFGDFEFVEGSFDHERSMLLLSFPVDELEEALTDAGIAFEKAEGGVLYSSSDVGRMAATLIPFVLIDGKRYPLGRPQKMMHLEGASIDKWQNEVLPHISHFGADFAALIDKMSRLKIQHPGPCLRSLAKEHKLNRQDSIALASDFETRFMGDGDCTAFDVFEALCSILATRTPSVTGLASARQVNDLTRAIEFANSDFVRNDLDCFEWREK